MNSEKSDCAQITQRDRDEARELIPLEASCYISEDKLALALARIRADAEAAILLAAADAALDALSVYDGVSGAQRKVKLAIEALQSSDAAAALRRHDASRGESYKADLMSDLRDIPFAIEYLRAAKTDSPEAFEVALRDLTAALARRDAETRLEAKREAFDYIQANVTSQTTWYTLVTDAITDIDAVLNAK